MFVFYKKAGLEYVIIDEIAIERYLPTERKIFELKYIQRINW